MERPEITKPSIVCLTRVWQSLLPLFCDKTFEFAIQTWQTPLEHYYVYVQTYFVSQLRKMLILLISSYCKMCTLPTPPTLQSRVFVCCEQYKHPRLYCWQWTHFTMGPNEQNQHFAQLRQNMCLYIHVVVLLTCLSSLDGKLELIVTKKWQKWLPNSSQTDYRRMGPHCWSLKTFLVHIGCIVIYIVSTLFITHFTCVLASTCYTSCSAPTMKPQCIFPLVEYWDVRTSDPGTLL